MAKEQREEEVCLPSDFLCDDHFLEEKRRRDDRFLEEFAMNLDWPAEDECLCMTGLAWQTPGSFLGDTKYCDGRYGFTAGSHGTALRGRFISEKKGSLDAPSLVALPPALSFSNHCETAKSGHCTSPVPIHLQRFQATQVALRFSSKDFIGGLRMVSQSSSISSAPNLFHQLKQQQQLMRQRLFAAWARQSEAKGGVHSHNRGRPTGLSSSARRPLQMQQQQQQPGSGMRAVFLSSPSARRESAGTGVFLPRVGGDTSEPPKKPAAYSTVLVPERVVQALNLNLEEMGGKPYLVLDHGKLLSVHSTLTRKRLHQLTKSYSPPKRTSCASTDALISRRDAVLSHQKRNHRLPHPTPPAIREIRLPHDWTY
ncbi:unnamed protein product [Musa acuminata subsp. malaccensis]|uniref:(wild Malaysian banana) hypothetical protein n=1 Tax=Musa acuminata subsp. malaccensis TaxID=214687 RepID=A0A804KW02_MUSAM|nr:unnamed protein product [Musa acuminata subsp. malaccensis]